MKALILSTLILFSCTKYSPLTKDAMGLRITDVEMPISHLNEIDWQIGKNKEGTVTQSFTFMVDMPKISEEDLEYLRELRGIDSWVIRLIVQRGSSAQDLGSLYARFKPRTIVRGQGGGSPTSVSLKVYYAAAYASERFRFFKCPAFSHSLRIDDMKIQGKDEKLELTIGQTSSYAERAQLVELAPSSFNGGNSLLGSYHVEIAPYDSVKKVTHSAFKRIPMYVEVLSEKNEVVKSCMGEHPELTK